MSVFDNMELSSEQDANEVFWRKVYPKMFCNMNHFREANRILDNGTVVGEFLKAVYASKSVPHQNASSMMSVFNNGANDNE